MEEPINGIDFEMSEITKDKVRSINEEIIKQQSEMIETLKKQVELLKTK